MPNETSIQRKIVAALRKRRCFVVKIHGSAMQPKIIDLLCCYRGVFVGIEVKRPGLDATVRQQEALDDIVRHGGYVTVAHDEYEALALIDSLDEKFRVWRVARKKIQRGAD